MRHFRPTCSMLVDLPNPHLTVCGEPTDQWDETTDYRFQPIDGGNYIFDVEERDTLLETEPDAELFLRPFVGAREYLQGGERWILSLHDASPDALARLSHIRGRIAPSCVPSG